MTGNTNRVYAISEVSSRQSNGSLPATGIVVMIAETEEDLEHFAAMGECEFSNDEWARLDAKRRAVTAVNHARQFAIVNE